MFLAYTGLDLAQGRQKKRLDRTEKREDYQNTQQQRRYKAGQRPDWDNGEDSDDDGKRYVKATTNAPERRNQLNPRERKEYVPPVAAVVPRNRRRINMAKVVDPKIEAENSDSDKEIDRSRSNRTRNIAKPSIVQDDRLSRMENFSARRNHENRNRNRRREETSSSDSDNGKKADSDGSDDMRARRSRILQKRDEGREERSRIKESQSSRRRNDSRSGGRHRENSENSRNRRDSENGERQVGGRQVRRPVVKAEILDFKNIDTEQKYEEEDKVIIPDSDESELSRESESEEKSSSEEESSSEEDDLVPKLRPVFMKKEQRATLEDAEDVAQRAEALEKAAAEKAEQGRAYTLSLVSNEIQREKEEQDFKNTKMALADMALQMARLNTDDSDEERAFGQWRNREFDRLKREKKVRDEEIAKEEALARRREKHESELVHEAYERRKGEDEAREKEKEDGKGDHKFLQRYYHGGIFYSDDSKVQELIKERKNAPTLEDHFDRSKLPEIYQNKYFGQRSNVKHQHLSKEDTSRKDAWGHNMEDDKRGNKPQKPR